MSESRTCLHRFIAPDKVVSIWHFNHKNHNFLLFRGRFIFLGSGSHGDGLLAYNASRNSVEGTACALRDELKPFGVSVVTLESSGVPAESLFKSPIPFSKFQLLKLFLTDEKILFSTFLNWTSILAISDIEGIPTQYSADVLTLSSLQVVERALFDPRPYETYSLSVPNNKFQCKLPCRSEFLRKSNSSFIQKVWTFYRKVL